MKKIKVMSIFGTRPEAIKMAPVVLELIGREEVHSIVVVTAQHREMLDQVLTLFSLRTDEDLNIMQEKQTLSGITIRALTGLEKVMEKHRPDAVLVQGDTTTAFVAALAAFYHKIPVGHVEAGLRTENKYSPYPEEMNRRLISCLGDIHFAPTAEARQNLHRNGIADERIYLTGNTVVDALFHILSLPGIELPPMVKDLHREGNRILFVETHRRENLGEPMAETCRALRKIVGQFEDVEIAFSVHKNPLVREVVFKELAGVPRVFLMEPLDYPVMVRLMKESSMVLTDSGGLQEEAPSVGKPVLVLRENTERPEGIRAGTAKLVGTSMESVFKETERLLTDSSEYRRMSRAANPYGDGKAARRTVDALLHYTGIAANRPDDFAEAPMPV
ncbi:MAG: UDP-N-acetylglucosamine 2-epimerase (non-hydrolyzing) [Candidatus Eremiobacteraeota bacterium]|nr:UDP-N-acetylglucosamine 2-epimerase (non-hydrolyzing) [Candidatus Eremiobacteraeota bacterium]